MKKLVTVVLALLAGATNTNPQTSASDTGQPKKTLGMVATAHLDTQWRWTVRNSIDEYIPATLHQNFKLMDLCPDYVFSFEGAFRYMLMKEYYPADYEKLRKYIARGQWRVTGSWVDAVDCNMPSFESLVRQTLYGNGYFKQEFGKTSRDVYLPDCFGFGYALPSIETHCGLKSFSSQKLSWGSAYGVPFDIGRWIGVDGSWVYAGLRPGSYGSEIRGDLSRDTLWGGRVEAQGKKSGLYAAYHYFGTGDTGGSPDSLSVDWLSKSIRSDGPVTVKSIGADDLVDMASSVPPDKLPSYRGELVMTRHGVGCYSSEAAMKRWNRKNEQLADAAERASVIATLLSNYEYPHDALRDTWVRFLWHQFHDDLTGTSIPEAYAISWNDEILCQNRFSQILENAVEATTPLFDTRAKGTPLVLFNPVASEREEVVEATVPLIDHAKDVRVFAPDGKEVPSQVTNTSSDSAQLLVLAKTPSVGYSVYDLRPSDTPSKLTTGLSITQRSMESNRYKVAVNDNGDVTSVFDKQLSRELLTSPIQYQMLFDKPKAWPAWEIWYDDIMAEPQALLGSPAEIRIVENGPARVALQIDRRTAKSVFRTVIRLAANSDRVEFVNDIDWYERETLLKVAFPLASANDSVTYDLGLGTIKRGLNHKELYEVVGQQWADMTAENNSFGVSILNDCKYGWDHPDKGTLRLTLIHTPGISDNWEWVGDQKSQDNGHHTFTFALRGHTGSWSSSGTVIQAACLNQPIYAFLAPQHKGTLGKQFSLLQVVGPDKSATAPAGILVNSVKLAENSRDLAVRVREIGGSTVTGVQLRFARPVVSASQINGMEEKIGAAQIVNGALSVSVTSYQPAAFALSLAPFEKASVSGTISTTIALPYNLDGISTDDNRKDGDFDGVGNSYAGELLPDTLRWCDVRFAFGPRTAGAPNVVKCEGQTIALPRGPCNRLNLLVAAAGGPAQGTFKIGDQPHTVWVQDYTEPIAQWNSRLINGMILDDPEQISPAYILRQPVAWYGSHRHNGQGKNEAYQFTYLYLLSFDVPPQANTLVLPANDRIRVFAATAVQTGYDKIASAQRLYDAANGTVAQITAERTAFLDPLPVQLSSPNPGAVIRFTTDGTDPTTSSAVYAGPVTLNASSTLKARAFLAGSDDHHVSAMKFQKLELHNAIAPHPTQPGLSCAYYEGAWQKLPAFDSLHAVRDTVADSIVIPKFARAEDFGLTFAGYLSIPGDGLYEFALSSDDGSRLWVSDSLVVDNDGVHGSGDVLGHIALKAGLHTIKVAMFQAKGDEDLSLAMTGPRILKQKVAGSLLSHDVPKTAKKAPVRRAGKK